MPKNKDNIENTELANLFDEAETAIKTVENVNHILPIPAVNELRYAGRHLIDAGISKEPDLEIDKAKRHCKRAIYDACDINLNYHLDVFDLYKNEFSEIAISDVIPKWHDMLESYHNIQDEMSKLSKVVTKEKHTTKQEYSVRDDKYKLVSEYSDKLQQINRKLDLARDDLIKKTRSQRKEDIKWFILVLLSFAAIIAAIF